MAFLWGNGYALTTDVRPGSPSSTGNNALIRPSEATKGGESSLRFTSYFLGEVWGIGGLELIDRFP